MLRTVTTGTSFNIWYKALNIISAPIIFNCSIYFYFYYKLSENCLCKAIGRKSGFSDWHDLNQSAFFFNEGTPFEVEISQMSCCLHLRWKTGRYQIFPNILEMQFHYLLHLFNLWPGLLETFNSLSDRNENHSRCYDFVLGGEPKFDILAILISLAMRVHSMKEFLF